MKLRLLLCVSLIGSSLTVDAWAQQKTAVKRASANVLSMKSEQQGAISVAFATPADGPAPAGGLAQKTINLGVVSYGGEKSGPNVTLQKHPGSFVVSTTFDLSLQKGSPSSSSAAILASLAFPDPSFTLRVDGIRLESLPKVITPRSQLGVTSSHRLEIEVPTSLTEKNASFQNGVIILVIPN